MIITDKNIEYIETSLSFYGIKDAELKEDFLDHICTHLENSSKENFELAYKEAIERLGGYASMQIIQREKDEKKLIQSFLVRKRVFYMISTFNLMLLALGFLFKLNQWPYSSILLAIGFTILIFITIPFAIYNNYKRSYQKKILTNS